ncbi:hypothetical protein H9L39_09148 [Fusarium oxysporum f. sp. albedinis]|nr:hypothetical protein H9L39_09148 [Fusarium oxysporum f. sp. albedinis]
MLLQFSSSGFDLLTVSLSSSINVIDHRRCGPVVGCGGRRELSTYHQAYGTHEAVFVKHDETTCLCVISKKLMIRHWRGAMLGQSWMALNYEYRQTRRRPNLMLDGCWRLSESANSEVRP